MKKHALNQKTLEKAEILLLRQGKAVVSPTKVGYIIATADRGGLQRKFELKGRSLKKPGVVLCSSVDQVKELAEMNPSIERLYRECEEKNILLGCILPWKKEAIEKYVPHDGSKELIMDDRSTSCFVIRFGAPSEEISRKLWSGHKRLIFASSANPSGQGNRGEIEGVGEVILHGVDMAIEADDYVAAQQPQATSETRYEQGVMVSMVDAQGCLTPVPTVIRKGLDVEKIMLEMSRIWDKFEYCHGAYY